MTGTLSTLFSPIVRYTKWLHCRWPAGTVEKMPYSNDDGSTNVPGVYIVGDLTGVPLLKFSADTGARAVQTILRDTNFTSGGGDSELYDLVIIGAGVSGISAAMEAQKAGLNYKIFEASQVFSTVVNFPKGKPIFTYPTEMVPEGLQFTKEIKEELVDEMESQRQGAGVEPEMARIDHIERQGQELHAIHGGEDGRTRAKRMIIAIGRSGNFRKIGCPGEDLDKVYNRLHDPKDYVGKKALVVGGGDSALETAIALATCGAEVTVSYRKREFSRAKPGNIEMITRLQENPAAEVNVEQPSSERVSTSASSHMRGDSSPGSIKVEWETTVNEIKNDEVVLKTADGETKPIQNDVVFPMIGREAPLDFFRRSGIHINGEWSAKTWTTFIGFFSFCTFVYLWKGGTSLNNLFRNKGWFPFNLGRFFSDDLMTLGGTLKHTFTDPGFYYAAAYSLAIVFFGLRRIQRRKTPYVKKQTYTLMAFQVLPLFLIPYFLIPMMGLWGCFDSGIGKAIADELFPQVNYGYGREYWRAFGLILAWPLFIFNLFTDKPLWGWIILSLIQTFIIIPLIVRRWGKGAYCGWICSCGAMAETMGDTHRQKMPHGPKWNRLNMLGQFFLLLCFLMLGARVLSWMMPGTAVGGAFNSFYYGLLKGWHPFGIELNYYHVVDIGFAGIVGVGMYFHFSGRVWCRFACPLAALMHIYARFTRFRIFAEKKKCISCNVCTSVCHQGIDIMNFANKGLPMEDPECVRCSACVQNCPTGVLTFGRFDSNGQVVHDKIPASLVHIKEHLNPGGSSKMRANA